MLLLNAACGAGGRKIEFVHFPTIGAADEAYFRPLENLEIGGARSYVGAIHHMHTKGGLETQLKTVRKFLPEFGLPRPAASAARPSVLGGC